jgi:hypothetical protein
VKQTRQARETRGNAVFLLEKTRNIGGGRSDQRRLDEIRTGRVRCAGGIAAYRHERKMDGGNSRCMRDIHGHGHAVRAVVMMMVAERALLVVRGIAGARRQVIVVVMMIMIAMLMHVQCGEDLAGIHAQGTRLEPGANAEHKKPDGNYPYQRRGNSG